MRHPMTTYIHFPSAIGCLMALSLFGDQAIVRAKDGHPATSQPPQASSVTATAAEASFAAVGSFPVQLSPYAVAVGDFNRDGKADLAVANQQSNTVSVLIRDGVGFEPAVNYGTGKYPQAVLTADFNRDGKPDL